jgi:hypothetical protein
MALRRVDQYLAAFVVHTDKKTDAKAFVVGFLVFVVCRWCTVKTDSGSDK